MFPPGLVLQYISNHH
uniref:Uncharacterized protein n=1 Tax=Anguilla anguilla TaxID=7936 RepID=A0A0E9T398_ANGAN